MAISASQNSLKNAEKQSDPFHKLVRDLSGILGPSSGLDSSDVDVQHLFSLMEAYISNETEWSQYAFSDFSRAYTRNLVDEGNGKSNLLILVWTPGKSSPIHDHADAHCLMRVLRGTLIETRFEFPSSLGLRNEEEAGLHALQETRYEQGQVTYMSDALGLHRIGNASDEEVAISLHLYTPPNAAKEGCHIFNERTGKKSWVTQSNFYSEFGRKR